MEIVEAFASETVGVCQCGCGKKTDIAKVTRSDRGHVKGQPLRFCHQHNASRVPLNNARRRGLIHCTRCGQDKDQAEFYRRKGRNGKQGKCRPCRNKEASTWRERNPEKSLRTLREINLRGKYGISLSDYERMFGEQNGACAICCKLETRKTKSGAVWQLHADHDHHTGKVSGLLCHYCNTAIGALGESESTLLRAIEYLKQHRTQEK